MLKRFFDLISSFAGLLFLSPVFLLIMLGIKIDSRGPVFFVQSRVGRKEKNFKLFKFRTMYMNAHRHGLITIGKKDPRVTPFGYYLRKLKLDEFPQLINVLIGDMSIVGPRPEVRRHVELYSSEQMHVLDVRPGITSTASIEFVNENELLGKSSRPEHYYINELMPRKLTMDLKYIQNRSFCRDIRIILATLGRILKKQ